MTDLDTLQRRKHAGRTFFTAACITRTRLEWPKPARKPTRYGQGQYRIEGVAETFPGADAVCGWFFEHLQFKCGVTTVYQAVRTGEPLQGRRITKVGTKRHLIGAVHEVRLDELHGAKGRR